MYKFFIFTIFSTAGCAALQSNERRIEPISKFLRASGCNVAGHCFQLQDLTVKKKELEDYSGVRKL